MKIHWMNLSESFLDLHLVLKNIVEQMTCFQIMKFQILSINTLLRKIKMRFVSEENKRKIGLMQRFLVSLKLFSRRSKHLPFLLIIVP